MTITTCKSCLYPTTKPDLHFVDGECAACRNYRARESIDWSAREVDFMSIIEKARRPGAEFDCIVPSSGGKDSTAQVIKMIELGVRPLVVTATTCHLTAIGRQNIDNLKRYATTIEMSPNKDVRAKLNKKGLELVGDISLPEHFAIFSAPFKAAVAFDIPLIVYGECPTMEYGGPPGSEKNMQMTRRYIMEHQGFLGMRAADFIGVDGITERDMADYMLPSDEKLAGISAVFLGQYYPWDSRMNARVAKDHGMQFQLPCSGNWWNFENLDNAQTGIHDWFGYLKYGYGRGAAQLSVDVRTGWMSLETARRGCQAIDGQFPEWYMGEWYGDILQNIGMTRVEFWDIAERFVNKTIFGDNFDIRRKSIR